MRSQMPSQSKSNSTLITSLRFLYPSQFILDPICFPCSLALPWSLFLTPLFPWLLRLLCLQVHLFFIAAVHVFAAPQTAVRSAVKRKPTWLAGQVGWQEWSVTTTKPALLFLLDHHMHLVSGPTVLGLFVVFFFLLISIFQGGKGGFQPPRGSLE